MEAVLLDIFLELRTKGRLGSRRLDQIIRRHNKEVKEIEHHCSKKKLLPFYLRIKESEPERWASWDLDEEMDQKVLRLLQMKPRRTASGVATITVVTKPWKCSSNCLYCPNDLRMPKSYLSGEPACQRAERNYFDPYLQVTERLEALTAMGHVTDKIELIVLGGTWCDYPQEYQIWFMKEAFRALNEGIEDTQKSEERRALCRKCGLSNKTGELEEFVRERQQEVNRGALSFNSAIDQLYGKNLSWMRMSAAQVATMEELLQQQEANETARHRMVGLVIETRPDTVSPESLALLRRMGCTKIQMGVQSLDPAVLALNDRAISVEQTRSAFELARVFGFKIQGHFMLNLYGSTYERDKEDYRRFVTEAPYQPDEIKLYPCSLVEGARLCENYANGSWKPYTEDELMDVLTADTLATPPFVRISRMIRDISAEDILVGNKKANLRQMVEHDIDVAGKRIAEIRHREIGTGEIAPEELELDDLSYETTVSVEHFLQWVTPDNRIAGFLRLSLPNVDYVKQHQDSLPVHPKEAMIREVHVYGKVARLHKAGENAQHIGLGKLLIKAASDAARANGYDKVNVISSIGTREYYRSLGFEDNELYQQLRL